MSILHTLKRKLRSCWRQQDAVSAHDAVSASSYRHDCPASSYAADFRKILAQLKVISARPAPELEPWVLAALERMESIGAAERLWRSKPDKEEINEFCIKTPAEQIVILNNLLDRVNILKTSSFWDGRQKEEFSTVISQGRISIEILPAGSKGG